MSCQACGVERSFRWGGAWEREARHAGVLAAELDIALDWQELSYYDVREIAALRLRLQRTLRQGPRRERLWPWGRIALRAALHRCGRRRLAGQTPPCSQGLL